MSVTKSSPKLGSRLLSKIGLSQILVLHLQQRSLILKLNLRAIRMVGNHLVMHLKVLLILQRKKILGNGIPEVLQCTTSLTSSLSVVQAGTFPYFLDQWESIITKRFVLNMLKGQHLQLKCHSLLFCNLKQLDIKASLPHCPVIHEVDELLAKGVIELFTGASGSYSNIL